MGWSVQGTFVETCSCNMMCPCWFAVQDLMDMDQGWCGTTILVRVESGDCDGVDLSGTDVAVVAHLPGPTLFDGDGTARIYLSDATSDEQRQHLEAHIAELGVSHGRHHCQRHAAARLGRSQRHELSQRILSKFNSPWTSRVIGHVCPGTHCCLNGASGCRDEMFLILC